MGGTMAITESDSTEAESLRERYRIERQLTP